MYIENKKNMINKLKITTTKDEIVNIISSLSQKELEELISKMNQEYRLSNAIVSDFVYDTIVEYLEENYPESSLLNKVGFEMDDNDPRKEKLPIVMASMTKVKSLIEIKNWMRLQGIPENTLLCISPKLDGLALLNEKKILNVWTRGDKDYGRNSKEHFKLINHNLNKSETEDVYLIGECIISRKNFEIFKQEQIKKGKEEPSNARNSVSGLINADDILEELKYADYIMFGAVINGIEEDKAVQIEYCNTLNIYKVPYGLSYFKDLNEEFLLNLYNNWKTDYEIDGLVIEVNDKELRAKIGRNKSSQNPNYARAYKGNFEVRAETEIKSILESIGKFGDMSYVAKIKPVNIEGVNISSVTLNNASYIDKFKLFEGEKITIIRSGGVIPKIIAVNNHPIPFVYMFNNSKEYQKAKEDLMEIREMESQDKSLNMYCPACGGDLDWDDNYVNLVCKNPNCFEQVIQKIFAFFNILSVDELGEPTIKLFIENGYNSIQKILDLTKEDLLKLERFGERKAEIVYTNIHSKLQNCDKAKLMHASSCFKKLGSKQLKLILDNPQFHHNFLLIPGIGAELAFDYYDNIKLYDEFEQSILKHIKFKEEEKKQEILSDSLKSYNTVFTGIRDKGLENFIVENGGIVSDGINKNVTHLIMKQIGSGSSKEVKATKMGIICIEINDFKKLINYK